MKHEVPIDPDSIFWKIYAIERSDLKEREPVIQLEWGWTAGMSDEDLKNIADDAPQGKGMVQTTLSMAKELRDDLDKIISKYD